MSIATAITRFRLRQAEQFTQKATVRRPLGQMVYDAELGEDVQFVAVLHVDAPCKVTALSDTSKGRDVQAGETKVRLADGEIKFHVGLDVAVDDLVEITGSLYHPLSVGKHYRVTDVDEREWQIAHKCVIEETIVPTLREEGS